ncbi:hypothetical protein RD110_08495 [Rhodoferax koreense]|uniref:Endolytic peptidoglycan transglycosylase RlpA n=1 Tax=Rhodoferax koreensis TaxID=1842727 RepID=A0A1P8JU65_9BURK|nr:septal ring lytic transglycosylase RlpA family protein [Rhodoferax koreense]APW37231.1 hypothetical protein RD110_08495 [Rhodoferax koreense]
MTVVRPLPSQLFAAALALLLASGTASVQAADAELAASINVEKTTDTTADATKDELPALAAAENIVKDAETGIASWYGNTFHRKRTASGEAFDASALTAAHPTLPFGTWVQVTLLSTGRSVVVRITDRGPHIANRLIDISRAAAAKIGLVQRGAGKVVIEPIAAPAGDPPKIR